MSAAAPALVVFTGKTELAWLRLLRPGFRHCFVLLDHGNAGWVAIDPLASVIDVALLAPAPAHRLIAWFENHGMTVLPARLHRDWRRPAPWAPFTCVEAVKRVLGLRDRRVITPWQLYRRLAADTDHVP